MVRIIKRKLKKIWYRPHLIDRCLADAGLESSPGDHMHLEFNLVKRLLRFTKCLYDQASEAGWHYVAR